MFFMRNYCSYLQVLCEAVQSREVNKSQLPRILNKIKLHISIEEQYTLSTQVWQFHHRKIRHFVFFLPESVSPKEGLEKGLRSCRAAAKSQQDQASHLHRGAIHALHAGLTVSHHGKNPPFCFRFLGAHSREGINPKKGLEKVLSSC
jgi:hypothetical protein